MSTPPWIQTDKENYREMHLRLDTERAEREDAKNKEIECMAKEIQLLKQGLQHFLTADSYTRFMNRVNEKLREEGY